MRSFATAHSRGLRRLKTTLNQNLSNLCHSAFARVATVNSGTRCVDLNLCHSAFARVATQLDERKRNNYALCHSAFARVATIVHTNKTCNDTLPQRIRAGCDQNPRNRNLTRPAFATAHSRGLRRDFYASANNADSFATAHSRGLRPSVMYYCNLPYGICHSAFARVATPKSELLIILARFATAHSRGLRRGAVLIVPPCAAICHSAFARVATQGITQIITAIAICHSAFARVATRCR